MPNVFPHFQASSEELDYNSCTMSEKHGLDAEIAIKMDAKYSVERESEAIAWIEEITGLQVGNDFLGGLKTGVVLCTLINKISPGSIPKFAAKPKHYLEHKVFFLNSCIENCTTSAALVSFWSIFLPAITYN